MRRCVSVVATLPVATIPVAWRASLPINNGGVMTTLQPICFNSSKFFGKRSGGSKKPTGGGSSLTGRNNGGSNAAGGGEGTVKEHARKSALESSDNNVSTAQPPSFSAAAVSNDNNNNYNSNNNNNNNSNGGSSSNKRAEKDVVSSSEMPVGKRSGGSTKKTRTHQRRKSIQKLTSSSDAFIEGTKREVRLSKKDVENVNCVATSGSCSVELSEEDVVVERASITKLFMVSDCVASIFCALPQNQRSIDNYLKEVDRAVLPPAAASECSTDGQSKVNNDRGNDYIGCSSEAVARREISERVLSEERANHTLCIHVRDMDQLVPPRHLLVDTVAKAPPAKTPARGTRRRKSLKQEKKISNITANSNATNNNNTSSTSLTPIERVLALQEWQMKALHQARESQERFKVPDAYHAITRVRFHDPPKADLTVVQGSGCTKTVADVLATMDRNLNRGGNGEYDEDDADGVFSHSESTQDENSSMLLSKPFALKPLLSVVASCIPRREPALGSRCGEEMLFGSREATTHGSQTAATATNMSGGTSSSRKARKSKKLDAAAKQLGAAKMGDDLLGPRVPPMPRFTTRVTVLVEHDELEPVDLLSMAEGTTVRRHDADSDTNGGGGEKKSASRKNRVPRIYCHIADGGEY